MSRSIKTRWAALLAVLAMVVGMLGFTSPAQAANGVTSQSTGSLTMDGLEDGVTVKAYKVIDVNWDDQAGTPASPRYTWNTAVKGYIQTNFPLYIDTTDKGAVVEAYLKADADQLASFYDQLSTQAKNLTATKTTTSTGGTAGDDASASATFSNLKMGSYLVLVTGGNYVYRASVASIWPSLDEATNTWKVENGTLRVKRSDTEVDKSVNEDNQGHVSGKDALDTGSDSAGIGDTVNFDLRAKKPVFPANAENKGFYLGDDLSDGLTLDAQSITVYGVAENGTETELTANTDYMLTTENAKRPDTGAGVSFLVNFHYDQLGQYTSVHVDYNATVNEKAVIGQPGNPNTVTLIYSNNPYGDNTYKTHEDKVKVFSYGLDVFKYHKVNNSEEALTGVEFTLKKSGSNDLLKVFKLGDGHYRLPAKGETATITDLAVGTATGNKGYLKVDGLDEGTYVLTESKRPTGYGLIAPIEFTIKDKDGSANKDHSGIEAASKSNDGYHSMRVENVPGLPNTGGIGTVVLTAAGVLLIAGGLLLAIRRKRA